jgi:hypothetical protein
VRYLLDTNILIEGAGNTAPAVAALQQAVVSDWVGYSAITRLELFGYPDLTSDEETVLDILTKQLEEVAVTSSVIDRAIQIRKSRRIKVPDAIIAATALEMDAILMTRNEGDFKAVDGLTIINPWRAG